MNEHHTCNLLGDLLSVWGWNRTRGALVCLQGVRLPLGEAGLIHQLPHKQLLLTGE